MRAEVVCGEDAEDSERDDFLDHLELDGSEAAVADAVGGHLEAVFEEGDDQLTTMTFHSGCSAELQVAVPGNRHEDVGADEKNNCPHLRLGCATDSVRSCGSSM